MRGATRDLQTRIEDLENALKTIGRIVADDTLTPKQRLGQAMGVCRMYECQPATPGPSARALPLEKVS